MSERGDYADGEFCWVDLATPDLDASAEFYGELMGWSSRRARCRRALTSAATATSPIGASRSRGWGQPPAWSSYVKTSDADATAAKVKEAGGTVLMGPMDIPGGAGRMTVCQDAEGAFISHWQPGSHHGTELVNEVGSWTWNNLMSRDPDAAAEFYGAVFGWTRAQPEGAPDFIWNWQLDGQRWPEGLAGLMAMGSDMPADAPPYWQVYLAVEKLDEAIEKTTGAGGRVVFGRQDTPAGRFATVFDPQGAVISLTEPDYPEPR